MDLLDQFRSLCAEKKYAEASQVMAKLLEQEPYSFSNWYNYALSTQYAEQHSLSADAFKRAYEIVTSEESEETPDNITAVKYGQYYNLLKASRLEELYEEFKVSKSIDESNLLVVMKQEEFAYLFEEEPFSNLIPRTEHPQVVSIESKIGNVYLESASPTMSSYAAFFEDNGETGYFYVLDLRRGDNAIVDAMHIYNTSDVLDGNIPSIFQIAWSDDGLKVALVINDYPHAVANFLKMQSFSRNAAWDDRCLQWFISIK